MENYNRRITTHILTYWDEISIPIFLNRYNVTINKLIKIIYEQYQTSF